MKNFTIIKTALLSVCMLGIQCVYSQQEVSKQVVEFRPAQGQVAKSTNLFVRQPNSLRSARVSQAVKNYTLVRLNVSELKNLYTSKTPKLEMSLPYDKGNLDLELLRVELFTPDFKLITSQSGNQAVTIQKGVFYRGMVKNDPGSLVTLSFFEHEVVGIIAFEQGNIVIVNYDKTKSEEYVIYNDQDLNEPLNFDCQTAEVEPGSKLAEEIRKLSAQKRLESRSDKCVRMYFELDYTLVTEKGGAQGAMNWFSGVFNQVQALYANDGITMSVSEIFAWTTDDPYTDATTNGALNKFRLGRPSFNGDLAHLVSRGAPTGGGVAYLNTLCTNYGYAYSWVKSFYSDFPVYSWTVNVIAHETGHNLGSPHTHNCSWAGGPIDGCGPTANAAYAEGSCAIGPVPTDGGTVMSYCHLLGTGINLTKGFGPLPLNLITIRINESTCLSSSCVATVAVPTNIYATDGTASDTVMVSWTGTAGNYFQVYRSMTNNSSTSTPLGNWQTSSTYLDLAVTPNQTYYYWVREAFNGTGSSASDYAGPETGWCNQASAAEPTSLSASDGIHMDMVSLTWSGISGNYYQVYRNTSDNTSTANSLSNWQAGTSFQDLTATPGLTYFYWVRAASNSSGSGISNYTAAENGWRAIPVSVPTALSASDGSFEDRVSLSWSGTPGNYFMVYRHTANNSASASPITGWIPASDYQDFSVSPNQTYFYWVREASDINGTNASTFSISESGWSFETVVVNIPTAVVASDGTYTDKIRVTWSGTPGNYFQVYRNSSNNSGSSVPQGSWQLATSYDDFTVAPNQTYFYWVKEASDINGINASNFSSSESGWSFEAVTVNIPTSVVASDGTYSDKVRVTWSGTPGNFFQVYRNSTNNSSTSVPMASWQSSTSFDDVTVTPNQTYYYWVKEASDNTGANSSNFSTSESGYSTVITVTIPASVSASDGTYSDKVSITWTGSADNYFQVYRNTTNSSSTAVSLGSWQTTSSFNDLTATAGQTYYYWVRAASNSAGANISGFSSSNSGWRSVVASSVPTGVSATDGTYTDRVAISWTGTAGNYFQVYRNTSNSSGSATAQGTWQTSTTYNDMTATANTTYYYWVRAASNSSGANISAFSASNSGWKAPVTVTVPTSVSASDGTYNDKVVITWNGSAGNYFQVYRYTSNNSSRATSLGGWQTANSFNDLTATANTTYYYWVKAASGSNGSNSSNFSSNNTGWRGASATYAAPFGLEVSQVTASSCVLNWNAVSGATNYSVWYNTGGAWTQIGTTTKTTISIKNLSSGTSYCFAVKTIVGSKTSDYSQSACIVTNTATGQITAKSVSADDMASPYLTQVTSSSLAIYPNPVIPSSAFSLRYVAARSEEGTFFLMDGAGRQIGINKTKIIAGENVFKINAPVTSGIYMVQLRLENGEVVNNKLMVH